MRTCHGQVAQNLPKRIYPKVNTYAKNPMKTDAEANNVFKMLNGHPPQRHKLGTIILNGDTQKRKEHHLSNILWGVTERQHRGRQKHKNGHNSGPWASPRWSSIDEDQHARPYILGGHKSAESHNQHGIKQWSYITLHSRSDNDKLLVWKQDLYRATL